MFSIKDTLACLDRDLIEQQRPNTAVIVLNCGISHTDLMHGGRKGSSKDKQVPCPQTCYHDNHLCMNHNSILVLFVFL